MNGTRFQHNGYTCELREGVKTYISADSPTITLHAYKGDYKWRSLRDSYVCTITVPIEAAPCHIIDLVRLHLLKRGY